MKVQAATMMIASLAGFVLVVMDLISKERVLRFYGWIILLVYLFLAAGHAYLVFGVTVKVKGKK
jgi:hypothetical protein